MADFKKIFQKQDLGLLLVRLMMGIILIVHGILHLTGKGGSLESFGKTLSVFGIAQWPLFWGIFMSVIEILVGACLIIGFFARLGIFLISLITLASVIFAVQNGVGFAGLIDLPCFRDLLLLPFIFIGSGAYSYDKS